MGKLGDLMTDILGIASLVGANAVLGALTSQALNLAQIGLFGLWVAAGAVTSYRYKQLQEVAENRGFEWMMDRLREASREKRRQIMDGEDP